MTKHHLTPTNPEIADVVVVGFDRPLSTFFAQVFKETDDDSDVIVWKGCTHGELPYAYQVIDLVRDHAHIPEELWEALDDDRSCAPFRTQEQANAVTHWSPTDRIDPDEAGDPTI